MSTPHTSVREDDATTQDVTGAAPAPGAPRTTARPAPRTTGAQLTSTRTSASQVLRTPPRPIPQRTAVTGPVTARRRPGTRPARSAGTTSSEGAIDACCRVAVVAYEVLQGQRTLQHLAALVVPEVLAAIEHRLMIAGVEPLVERRVTAHRVRVTRVRAWVVSAAATEVAVVVSVGGRARAVAARAELRRDRWRVSALVLG